MNASITKLNEHKTYNNGKNKDLISQAFSYVNDFKRSRTIAEASRKDNNMDKAIFNELKQYKSIDGLELTLRAIQKGLRELDELDDEG